MVVRISDPMAYNASILLGKIIRAYGFEGAVTIKLEKIFTGDIPKIESVFLEIEGKQVPFIVSGSEDTGGDILRLKFDGYDSVEKISEFTGCRVFLTAGETVDIADNELQSLNGYKIFVSGNKMLGIVSEVVENPGQLLLKINNEKGEEILIPLHKDFIISLDNKKKTIKMNLPKGLTEINQ